MATGKSLWEVYDEVEDHAEFLDALERRLPSKFEDASPMDWAGHLLGYGTPEGARFKGLASNAVGQMAEDNAIQQLNSIDALQEAGVHAEGYESRTHPGTDIRLVDEDGDIVDDIQVKSYSSSDQLLARIEHYEEQGLDVDHYIVNREVYQQLKSTGDIEELADRGIVVTEGWWSHRELVEGIEETAVDLGEATDVAEQVDEIDVLRWIGFGLRTARRGNRLLDGSTTAHEAGVDTFTDASGVVARGATTVGLAKLGAAVGTAICPGIGTVLGGALGAAGGAVSGSFLGELFRSLSDQFKYGRISELAQRLGDTYEELALYPYCPHHERVFEKVFNDVFQGDALQQQEAQEGDLLGTYGIPDPYSWSFRLSAPSLIAWRMWLQYFYVRSTVAAACRQSLWELSELILEEDEDSERNSGYLGEMVAMTDVLVVDELGMDDLVQEYRGRTSNYPSHPYRFRVGEYDEPIETEDLFLTMCHENLEEANLEHEVNPYPPKMWPRAVAGVAAAYWIAIAVLQTVGA